MKTLYLQLNEPGSGSVTLPKNTQAAKDALLLPYIDLDLNGRILGGFLNERPERTPIDVSENAGRVIKLSGRGPLALLDFAIVRDWGTPDLEKERYFNSIVGGDSFAIPMVNKGHILHALMSEAMYLQTNPNGDVEDRQCWHDSFGNHMVSWAFNATQDSDAVPWDGAELEDLRARVGCTYLELARQYAGLGQPTPPNVFDVEMVHLVTGVFDFRIHQTAIGLSVANAITHFKEGVNVLAVSDVEDRTKIKNSALVAYTDPVFPYVDMTDPVSITAWMRREEIFESSNAETYTQAGKMGRAELDGIKDPSRVITLKISGSKAPLYGTDYNLGDWVFYEDDAQIEIPVRLHSLSLEWDDNVPLIVTAEAMPV